ncbi:MAG TPA: ferric reductase-like transmembrane domain-containing protein [Candidatus Binatia bacterium]|nr:ferric reductase-like transmembrane domain-containing protein [Candidatus Binatia bacterium]
MHLLRLLSIPALTAVFVAVPVLWALPEGLTFWRTLAIVLGWGGCGLLLASLLLILRETALAHSLGGLERMYRWHHFVGVGAYLLLLAHPLALAADAWQESPHLAWQLLSPVSQGWPVWLGWISLLFLMSGLAVTFSAKVPYRTWRWLHGVLSIGVLFGMLHLVLLGISEAVIAAVLLAVLLLAWRVIRVDLGTAARPFVVQSVDRIADAVVEIALRPLSAPVASAAGQFVLVAFFDGAAFRGCREYHPFTVSSIQPDGQISIGVKSLGDCTQMIQSVEVGVAARVQGPFGVFLAERPPGPELWVAGGIGITPFIALLRESSPRWPTTLLYLYRRETDAAFLNELRTLAAAAPLLSLKAIATGGDVPDLPSMLPDSTTLAGWHCYLCGPPALITGVRQVLVERGVKTDHIHFERFDFR